MNKFVKYLGRTLAYFLELLIGVVLLIDPEGFTSTIVIVAGIAMIVVGVWYALRYFRTEPVLAMREHDLATGLFLCAAGLLFALKTDWIIATFSIMTVMYGIAMLILGFIKIQATVDLLRAKSRGWVISAVNAVLTVLFSVIVFIKPFATMVVLWRFTAVSIIVISLLDILVMILSAVKNERETDNEYEGEDN